MYWLQDLTWAGAPTIIDLLKTFPKDYFMPYYEKIVRHAVLIEDEDWLHGLSIFVRQGNIEKQDFKDEKLYDELLHVYDED